MDLNKYSDHLGDLRRRMLKEQVERQELLNKITERIIAEIGGAMLVEESAQLGYKFSWRGHHDKIGEIWMTYIVSHEEFVAAFFPFEVVVDGFLVKHRILFNTLCQYCGKNIFKKDGVWLDYGDKLPPFCEGTHRGHMPKEK